NPSPSKSNYVNFLGKLFNVILVKEERPPLQKSAAWLIEPTDRARSPSSIPLFLAGARSFLFELHALHIDLFLHQQGLDTTTPAGTAIPGSEPVTRPQPAELLLPRHHVPRGQGLVPLRSAEPQWWHHERWAF